MTLMTSGVIQQQLWRPFHKTSSKIVLEGWTRRWHRCIASQGEYFEGDHGGIQQWGISTFTAKSSRNLLSYHVFIVLLWAEVRVGRDSSVGIAIRYELNSPGIESRFGRDFPYPSRPAVWPTQPLSPGQNPLYPLNTKLGGPRSRSGRIGEEENLLLNSNPGPSSP